MNGQSEKSVAQEGHTGQSSPEKDCQIGQKQLVRQGILGFHGIWRGLSSGISEVSLVLGGRWVPSGFHRKVLCSSIQVGLSPHFFLLSEGLVSLHVPPLCHSPPLIYNPVFCAIKSCPLEKNICRDYSPVFLFNKP